MSVCYYCGGLSLSLSQTRNVSGSEVKMHESCAAVFDSEREPAAQESHTGNYRGDEVEVEPDYDEGE